LVYPWEVSSGGAIEPVAREVLRVFGSYGWLAIQAALDNPGYPKDPAVRWPRTFPKIPRGLFHDEVAAARRSRAELEELMKRADRGHRASRRCSPAWKPIPTPGFAIRPPGGCSTGPAKNAAAKRCGPPPPKMRTSKSAGSPDTLSDSLAKEMT